MNKILKFTIETLKYSDISYNYIIGEDGNVYEGRGTYKAGFQIDDIAGLFECLSESRCKGAHTRGNSKRAFPGVSNSNTIGIAILGDFTSK